MPVSTRFDELVGELTYSMFVVTARRGQERGGCLVGFTTQVSIDPSRFLVCVSVSNHTYGLASEARHLAVHAVPADRMDLAELFGGETEDEVDKFARCTWTDGPEGLPILDGCRSWFVGSVVDTVPFGDHAGFVLEPTTVHHEPPLKPLLSPRAVSIDAGHDA